MPFPPRPIDSTLRGVPDYSVGAMPVTGLPRWPGVHGTESAQQIRTAGAVHAAYSTLTDSPLGVIKLIPYKAHLALDAIGALSLAATPFVTGQQKQGRRHWVRHVDLCLFELSSLAMSDPTGKRDFHGDIDTIRRSNTEDPQPQDPRGPARRQTRHRLSGTGPPRERM